jgi:molybdate transport system substrate-binding protein
LLALACGLPFSIVGQQDAAPLLVAAASDLAPVEADLSRVFRRAGGGSITFTLASSGMLARQIQQGAPYDVYLSANEGFVQELVSSGHLVAESVRIYAHGRIALWSKSGTIRSLSDLHDKKVLHVAIANPAHAPYGMAAREALQSQGVWKSLGPKLVYGENVRQAFQLAESGNADAVITAWTLVFDKGGILLPEDWHPPIRQAGSIVKTGRRQHSARRFLDFLTSEQGRKLLTRFGLFPPKPSGGRDRRPPSGR